MRLQTLQLAGTLLQAAALRLRPLAGLRYLGSDSVNQPAVIVVHLLVPAPRVPQVLIPLLYKLTELRHEPAGILDSLIKL